jgi:hypothetical protein
MHKLKHYLFQNFFYTLQEFSVTIGGSLVIRVSFDMIQKYIDCLWSVIFTKCVMLCFTWMTCIFSGLIIFIALYCTLFCIVS